MLNTTIDRDALNDLTELVEDSVACVCDEHILSGELAWSILQCLARAKTSEFH